MGNYLKSDSNLKDTNKVVVKRLRKLRLFDVHEIFQDFFSNSPDLILTYDSFDENFSPVLNNTMPLFQCLRDNDVIDVRQALIAMTIFSQGDFDDKLQSVFGVYDADNDLSINRKDLGLFLKDSILGLCKLIGLTVPSNFDIQEYCFECYTEVDTDGSGDIDFDEFMSWVKSSESLQEFLLKHTGVQTLERAQKRYDKIKDEWLCLFKAVAIEYCGDKYVEMVLLKNKMDSQMSELSQPVRDRLYQLLNYGGREIISEEQYEAIIRPMAVFSAVDINNNDQLDIDNIKMLLWLFDGQEPTPLRIQQEMANLDTDHSGTIDRLEFIAYLTSGQEGDYDYKLRADFDNLDINKDGYINMSELICYLKQKLSKQLESVPFHEEFRLPELFNNLASDCVRILQTYSGIPGKVTSNFELPWTTFKHIQSQCHAQIEFAKEQIELNFNI